jgi:hypothetical protein
MNQETKKSHTVRATKIVQASESSYRRVGYWVVGEMPGLPKVGERLYIAREERNGEKVPGLFSTSPVTKVTYLDPWRFVVQTENSTWLVEDV